MKVGVPMRKLLAMVFSVAPKQLLLQLVLRVVFGMTPALTALLWRALLLEVEGASDEGFMFVLFASLALIGGISVSYHYFMEIVDTLLRNRLSNGLQKLVHQKADDLPYSSYEDSSLEDTLSRASTVFCYGDAVGFMVRAMGALQYTVTLVSLVHVVGELQPQLTVIAIVLMIPAALRMWMNTMQVQLELKLSPKHREARVIGQYITSRQSAKEIRVMNAGSFFMHAWEKSMRDIIVKERSMNFQATCLRIGADVIERSATIGAYALCIFFAMAGQVSAATLGALIVLMGQMIQSSSAFMRSVESIHQYVISMGSAMQYFQLPDEQRQAELDCKPRVLQFTDVSYCYPGATRNAVSAFNITLQVGETLAVVGVNGSGKTTLSKLVLGLLDPSEGTVTINGVSSKTLAFSSLYGRESAVFQNHVRYAMQLRDNIQLSSPQIPLGEEDMFRLLRSLGIDFVHDKTGIDAHTELGTEYGGRDLSGGEWQQLAIARAAFRSSDIMVLDEPSSSLDPLRESALYQTFQNLCQNRIGVIITHRLGLCAFADKILVMDEGKMAEYGTHSELMQQDGLYAEMYHAQQGLHYHNPRG